MISCWRIFFPLLVSLFFLAESNAKVVYKQYPNTQEVTIQIENEIEPRDLMDFKSAIKQLDESKKILRMNSVVLNSHGGSGDTGKEIGNLIRARKLNTYLSSKSDCASACVYILISGVQRYAFGNVRVHRATFMGEFDGDSNVAKLIRESQKSNEHYVNSMGVSSMLADAIESTESWGIRKLTEREKKQWQVFGFDRLGEELYFNESARDRHISRHEFIDIFKSHYDDCLREARDFKQTVFDCAKTKKLKDQSYHIQILKWLSNKLDSYLDTDAKPLPFHEQVESLRKKIRDGKLYLRYTTLIEIFDMKPTSSQLKPLDSASIQRMEETNKWWVEGNKLSVLIMNPVESDLKEIIFELTNAECNTEGSKKYLLSLPLLVNLESKSSAIYSGQLPFSYDKMIGKGTRCGVIKAAFN